MLSCFSYKFYQLHVYEIRKTNKVFHSKIIHLSIVFIFEIVLELENLFFYDKRQPSLQNGYQTCSLAQKGNFPHGFEHPNAEKQL